MRSKRDLLSQALQGQIKPHHRFLLSEQLADIDGLDEAIERMSTEIAGHLRPYEQQIQRLSTIPGIKRRQDARHPGRDAVGTAPARLAGV